MISDQILNTLIGAVVSIVVAYVTASINARAQRRAAGPVTVPSDEFGRAPPARRGIWRSFFSILVNSLIAFAAGYLLRVLPLVSAALAVLMLILLIRKATKPHRAVTATLFEIVAIALVSYFGYMLNLSQVHFEEPAFVTEAVDVTGL